MEWLASENEEGRGRVYSLHSHLMPFEILEAMNTVREGH